MATPQIIIFSPEFANDVPTTRSFTETTDMHFVLPPAEHPVHLMVSSFIWCEHHWILEEASRRAEITPKLWEQLRLVK